VIVNSRQINNFFSYSMARTSYIEMIMMSALYWTTTLDFYSAS